MTPEPSPPAVASAAETRRTIVALNMASALAQVAQYGIGFVVLPVWLARLGVSPAHLGLLGALQWFGMLAGIQAAPRLVARWGARRGVGLGLGCSAAGFAALPFAGLAGWAAAAAAIGFGLGLRWIALEPWLYGLIPQRMRGRIVGVHEALIGVAPVVGPALAAWLGMGRTTPTLLALGATLLGLLPLAWASAPPAGHGIITPEQGRGAGLRALALGLGIAIGGGLIEGSFTVLVPLMGKDWAMSAQQMAWLLSVYGVGGLLLQFPIGWLADHRGIRMSALVVAAATALGFFALTLARGDRAVAACMFLLGGSVNAFLTLAMVAAVTSRAVAPGPAVARISWSFTAASGIGPLLLGAALQSLGVSALPPILGAVSALLAGALLAARGPRAGPDTRVFPSQ